MKDNIFYLPVKKRHRTPNTETQLEAATEWLLAELGEPVTVKGLRELAEKELKRPRDAVHKTWAEVFLAETGEHEKK